MPIEGTCLYYENFHDLMESPCEIDRLDCRAPIALRNREAQGAGAGWSSFRLHCAEFQRLQSSSRLTLDIRGRWKGNPRRLQYTQRYQNLLRWVSKSPRYPA